METLLEQGQVWPRAVAEDRMAERRATPSAWQDPRTWVSILGILLTILVVIGTFISAQLSSIHADINTLTVAQTANTTRQAEQIREIQERQRKQETDTINQTAYNLHMSEKLTEIRAILQTRKIATVQP